METTCIIELTDFLEAQLFVGIWADPLSAVNCARRKRLVDLAAWKRLYRCTGQLKCPTADTRHAELQAAEIISRVDLFVEPAAGLHVCASTGERLQVEDLTKLVVEIVSTAVVVPSHEFFSSRAKRHGCEVIQARMLPTEIVVGGVVDVSLTGRHRIKHLERTDEFAGCFLFDGDLTVGHLSYSVCKVDSSAIKNRKAVRHRCNHGQGPLALSDGRGRERGSAGNGRADACL